MTFYIERLGCSKNQVDAEALIAFMQLKGHVFVEAPEDSELIIINSCGFIESAKTETINTSLELRSQFPEKKIIMAGCMSQRYGNELQELLGEIDGFIGNHDISALPDAIDAICNGKAKVVLPERKFTMPVREKTFGFPGTAYVKIAEGCNNKCAFCAIPLIRGKILSRTIEDIVGEIQGFLKKGIKEINLVAQDIMSFGIDQGPSQGPELLRAISNIEGDFWVRILYAYPDHFSDDVIDICKNDQRILPYFDIPFQHGSTRILKKMGRPGSKESYLELINHIRKELPQAVIRSTFLLGFPGESQTDVEELLDFQAKAQIDWLGAFVYSREEGTRAYNMIDDDAYEASRADAVKAKQQVEEQQQAISSQRLERYVGTQQKILIEEEIPGEDLYIGRAYCHAPEVDGLVVVHGEDLIPGTFVDTRIIKVNGLDLEAVLDRS